MDYLNRAKTRRNQVVLLVGYVLVTVAIVIGTLVLLYQAYGFGFGKNGSVIQNGLVFFSSQPNPAKIYLNGQLNAATTNSRLTLPANVYQVRLTRSGYRSWQRTVDVYGGSVEHFDYPFLFPTNLVPKKIASYASAPGLVSQSPDRRWLLIEQPGSNTNFDLYDLKNPSKPPTTLALPSSLLSKASVNESWQVVSWADDNQHVLLEHTYDGQNEYILLNRADPSQAVNLNSVLSASSSSAIALNNKKYNQYYLFDSSTATLSSATLSAPTLVPIITGVIVYQPYGSSTVLYITSDGAPKDEVLVKLFNGTQTYNLRSLPSGTNYLLDLTEYNGIPYIAIGAGSINKVYIYRDPVGQLAAQPDHAIVPAEILHVNGPNYVSFSDNAQFIMAENGQNFSVYDIENNLEYNYTSSAPLDPPQLNASWMDGDRLMYVSNGHLNVADYDDINRQSLMPAAASYLPVFSPTFNYVFDLAPAVAAGQYNLTETSLLTPTDQ